MWPRRAVETAHKGRLATRYVSKWLATRWRPDACDPRFTKALRLVLSRALASIVARFHIWNKAPRCAAAVSLGPGCRQFGRQMVGNRRPQLVALLRRGRCAIETLEA